MNFIKSLSCLILFFCLSGAESVQLTGRVLEKSTGNPVSGAAISWKGASGNIEAVTDSTGHFTLFRNVDSHHIEWKGRVLERGVLHVNTVSPDVRMEVNLYNAQGKSMARSTYHLEGAGIHHLPLLRNASRNFVGFLKIRAGEESYLFRIFEVDGHGSSEQARFVSANIPQARKMAGDTLKIASMGFVTKKVRTSQTTGDIGDIVMDRAFSRNTASYRMPLYVKVAAQLKRQPNF